MQEDYAKAMADYSKIIELYPKNPEGYLLRAEAFIVQKLYPKALDNFRKSSACTRRGPTAIFCAQKVYVLMKDYDKAVAEYTEVLRQNPQDVSALKYRCTTFNTKKDFAHAIQDMNTLIALFPTEPRRFRTTRLHLLQRQRLRQLAPRLLRSDSAQSQRSAVLSKCCGGAFDLS